MKLSGFLFYFCDYQRSPSRKKGIEKNLWAKKFIKNIDYSKEEIALILYYKSSFEEGNPSLEASGWAQRPLMSS